MLPLILQYLGIGMVKRFDTESMARHAALSEKSMQEPAPDVEKRVLAFHRNSIVYRRTPANITNVDVQ
ncbi:hypothetical protein [Coriobacterium glomerans]|uniref:hypothetical protein n=1 Tax=Coriobacterium glomerans TaxID=33871 RepID=UPI0002DFF9BD|nr:hypothetical protein [Coriobacterium glomerans]